MVNHTRLARLSEAPTPLFELLVQRGLMPGQPGARLEGLLSIS